MELRIEETESETKFVLPRKAEHGDCLVYTSEQGQHIVLWYAQGHGWRAGEDA